MRDERPVLRDGYVDLGVVAESEGDLSTFAGFPSCRSQVLSASSGFQVSGNFNVPTREWNRGDLLSIPYTHPAHPPLYLILNPLQTVLL